MAEMAEEELGRLRELHWMKCPRCGMDLHTIDLHGAKIEACSGTFFDNGELEQVMARGGGFFARMVSLFR